MRAGDYVGVMRSGADSPLLLTDRDLVRPIIAQAAGRRDANDLGSLTGASGDTLPTPGGGLRRGRRIPPLVRPRLQ